MDKNHIHNSVADLRVVLGTHALPSIQSCFNSYSFWQKMAKNGFAPPPLDWRRLLGNPGTAIVILSCTTVVDLRGVPTHGPKFSQFHAEFWKKLAKWYVGTPGGLAPHAMENPGSGSYK